MIATAAEAAAVMCMAWMNASLAGWISTLPRGPIFCATPRVASIDSPAACRLSAGRLPRWVLMPLR